jgi:hypothetical protein
LEEVDHGVFRSKISQVTFMGIISLKEGFYLPFQVILESNESHPGSLPFGSSSPMEPNRLLAATEVGSFIETERRI